MRYSKLLRRLDPSLRAHTGGDVRYPLMTQAGWQVRRVVQEDGELVLELAKQAAPDDCLRLRVHVAA